MKKRTNPEDILHRSVAQLLAHVLRPPTIWTTIGHGGGGKVRGAQLKAKGMQPGWPDILVMYPGEQNTIVLGIELKAGSRVSKEQVAMREKLWKAGGAYWICRSQEQVLEALVACRIPTHGRLS